MDLPKRTYVTREIELTGVQRRLYNEMRKYALSELDGKVCSTSTVMVQLLRLHQISCGHFSADDGTILEVKNNRLAELLDVLDEVEGKAIIWAHYQHDVRNSFKLL